MELRITPDAQVSEFVWSTGAGYPYVPTLVDLDVSFGSDRTLAAPDAARATVSAWLPDSSAATHLPAVGDPVRFYLDDEGDRVPLFAGRVDKVVRARRRGRTSTPATRVEPETFGDATRYVRSSWSQFGVDTVTRGDVFPVGSPTITIHPDTVDGELTLDGYQTGRLAFPPGAVQPRSWLWATDRVPLVPDRPSPVPPPGTPVEPPPGELVGESVWWWRANGQHYPVVDGPLHIGDTVPPDLALVTWVKAGSSATVSVPVMRPALDVANMHPSGEWLTITASDDLATAARHKIGAEPWPVETVWERLDRIAVAADAAGVPTRLLRLSELDYSPSWRADAEATYVAARDVDNVPALDLWAETLSAVAAIPVAIPGAVGATRAVEHPLSLHYTGTVTVNLDAVQLPLALVPDAELSSSCTTLTNRLRVGYVDATDPTGDPVDRTHELVDERSIARWGESSARWATPVVRRPGDPEPEVLLAPLVDRLGNALAALSWPEFGFEGDVTLSQTILDKMPPAPGEGARFARLLDMRHRHGQVVALPVPGVTARGWTAHGGSFVWETTGQLVVTLALEPAGRSGAPALPYGTMDPALTFGQLAAVSPDLTFLDTRRLAP